MIILYSNAEKMKLDFPDYMYLMTCQDYFIAKIDPDKFDDTDYEIIKTIDNIKFMCGEPSIYNMKSMFGPVSYDNLSTGCKCALTLRHIIKSKKKIALDLIECGGNALSVCFEAVNNTGVPVVIDSMSLRDANFNYEFKINGSSKILTGRAARISI